MTDIAQDLTGQGQAAETFATDQAIINWKDKYHGLKGAFEQQQAKWRQEHEALRQAAVQHQERVGLLESQLKQAVEEMESLRNLAKERDAFLAELETTRRQLGRLSFLVDQGISDPAIRSLVLSSTLPDDQLQGLIEQLKKGQQAATQQALAQAAQGSVPPNVPAAKGNSQVAVQDVQARMEKALREGRLDGPDGYWALLRTLAELSQ